MEEEEEARAPVGLSESQQVGLLYLLLCSCRQLLAFLREIRGIRLLGYTQRKKTVYDWFPGLVRSTTHTTFRIFCLARLRRRVRISVSLLELLVLTRVQDAACVTSLRKISDEKVKAWMTPKVSVNPQP